MPRLAAVVVGAEDRNTFVEIFLRSISSLISHKAHTCILSTATHSFCRFLVIDKVGCSRREGIHNQQPGKNVSICLFKSCSHQGSIRVFTFLPMGCHRVPVECCEFCPQIGHTNLGEATGKNHPPDQQVSDKFQSRETRITRPPIPCHCCVSECCLALCSCEFTRGSSNRR